MTKYKSILESLTRSRLIEITRNFQLFGLSVLTKDELIDVLARKRKIEMDEILSMLKRDELKTICRALGRDDGGAAKFILIDRILDSGAKKKKALVYVDTSKKKRPERSKDKEQKQTPSESNVTKEAINPAMTGKNNRNFDTSALEQWLWDAACVIRGPVDAPKFKDFILPLLFLKRLSDVFEDEVGGLATDFGDAKTALKLVEQDHKLVRFFIPKPARWTEISLKPKTGLGEYLTDAVRAVARENPRLSGVIDIKDFNETAAGQRILDDDRLHALIQELSEYRLSLDDVEPDVLGRAYEYLLRKFSEGQGQSAGEFYTPREVAILMARILDPEPGMKIYDPCAGSGGLLIKAHLRLVEKHGQKVNGHLRLPGDVAPLKSYGQEINHSTFAMARMNAFIHDMEAEIALGDTMNKPVFTEGDGGLRRFDLVTANPMWNQKFGANVYENDTYGRFGRGTPPTSSADWGWIQHMFASLNDNGKMALVIDTGAASRGSGNQGSNKERDVRKTFVEDDMVEAVFLMPENMFYNTPAPGIIIVLNRNKKHKGMILLVNGSTRFSKGRPKNYLTEAHIQAMADAYLEWKTIDHFSAVITKKALAFDSKDVKGVIEGVDVLKEHFKKLIAKGQSEYLVIIKSKKADKQVEALLEHFRDKELRQEYYSFFKEIQDVYEILSPDAFLRPYC